jgi:hypothetical protein
MAKLPEKEYTLDSLNHSELVLLANFNGLNASRAAPREVLIDHLQTFTPFEERPFDWMREALNTWLVRWWNRLRMQMPKKVCPDCYQCRDAQILDCYSRNRANLERT